MSSLRTGATAATRWQGCLSAVLLHSALLRWWRVLAELEHPIADAQRLIGIMSDMQRGHATLTHDLREFVSQTLTKGCIQGTEWLVEQEHCRVSG